MLRPTANQALGGPTRLPSARALPAAPRNLGCQGRRKRPCRGQPSPWQGRGPPCRMATSTRGSGRRGELTQQKRAGARGSSQQGCRDGGQHRAGGAMGTWKSICCCRCQEDSTAGKAACTQRLPGEQDWEVKGPSWGQTGTVFAMQIALGKQEGWDSNPRRCTRRGSGRDWGVGARPLPPPTVDTVTGKRMLQCALATPAPGKVAACWVPNLYPACPLSPGGPGGLAGSVRGRGINRAVTANPEAVAELIFPH